MTDNDEILTDALTNMQRRYVPSTLRTGKGSDVLTDEIYLFVNTVLRVAENDNERYKRLRARFLSWANSTVGDARLYSYASNSCGFIAYELKQRGVNPDLIRATAILISETE